MTQSYDVVIVGGAVMGSSTAYWLTARQGFANQPNGGRVLVVEKDPTYTYCATTRSAGSIRQQFSTPENIAISLFGIDFLRRVGDFLAVDGDVPAIGLKEKGYLFLASEAGRPILEKNHRLQIDMGADNVLLDAPALQARFPWLSTEGIAAGCLGLSMEGWLDPQQLLQGFRRKARAQGAEYRNDEVVGLERQGDRVTAVQLRDGGRIGCGMVVNASGLFGSEVAAMAGIDLPVRPKKRNVFVVDCREPLPNCPLVIDKTGAWFRPEGAFYVCGIQPDEANDPDSRSPEVDHSFFEETLWPLLAERIPALESIKVVNAWAGHYDYNLFDQNAVLGPHPEVRNFLLCNGFSGHGLQQSPAVGRALSELIAEGRYVTLDLSRFGYERIAKNEPIVEENVV